MCLDIINSEKVNWLFMSVQNKKKLSKICQVCETLPLLERLSLFNTYVYQKRNLSVANRLV